MHSPETASAGLPLVIADNDVLLAFNVWLPFKGSSSREQWTLLRPAIDRNGIRVDLLREERRWIMRISAGNAASPPNKTVPEQSVFAEVDLIDAIQAEEAVQHQVVLELTIASGRMHVWVNGDLEGVGNVSDDAGHRRWFNDTLHNTLSHNSDQLSAGQPQILTGVREYHGTTFRKCPRAAKVLRGDWLRHDPNRKYTCIHGKRRRFADKSEGGRVHRVNNVRYHPLPAQLDACQDTDRAGECTYLKQQAAVDICMEHFNMSAGHGKDVCSDPYFGGSSRCCYNELTGLCLTCRFFLGASSRKIGIDARLKQLESDQGNCTRAVSSCAVRYLSQCGLEETIVHSQSSGISGLIGLSSGHVSKSFVARRDACIRTPLAGFWRHSPYVFRGDFSEIQAFNTDLKGCADACGESESCSMFEYGQTDFVCRYAPPFVSWPRPWATERSVHH